MAKSPSPSIWSRKISRERYRIDEFVEIPKVKFDLKISKRDLENSKADLKRSKAELKRSRTEHKRSKKEHMRSKTEQKVSKKKKHSSNKEAPSTDKRRKREKRAPTGSAEQTREVRQKTNKRKVEDTTEQNQSCKRHRSQKSQKAVKLDSSIENTEGEGRILSKPKMSKQAGTQRLLEDEKNNHTRRYNPVELNAEDQSDFIDTNSHSDDQARKSSCGDSNKENVQHPLRAGADVQEAQLHERSSGSPASSGSKQHKPRQNVGWQDPWKRREIEIFKGALPCSCSWLPEYFTENPKRIPRLETWRGRGDRTEFLEHIKQISSCPGSIHPPHVVGACKKILEARERWNLRSLEPAIESTKMDLSTNNQNGSNLQRAQSSIPPSVFYGDKGRHRSIPTTEDSSRPTSEMENVLPSISVSAKPPESVNQYTSSRDLPRRGRSRNVTNFGAPLGGRPSNPTEVVDSPKYLTPPNSSPLGKEREMAFPSRLRSNDGSPSEQEVVSTAQATRLPLKQSTESIRSRFDTQRRRHQSMPIEIFCENPVADGRIAPPSLSQQQRRNILNEISDNGILNQISDMKEKLVTVEKAVQGLPRTTHPPVHSATAPAPTPAQAPPHASTRNTNDPEQRTQKKKKRNRPTVAEKKLTHPVLDRYAPAYPDLTEVEIIEIGRMKSPYERHSRAQQAFDWRGHFYEEFEHLLLKAVDGKSVWTAKELKRLVGR